jgi:serine/threonine-protein kinase HipA
MAFKRVELVEVSAWGNTVGAVARDPRSGYFAFEYEPSWVKRGIELSPLHLRNARGFLLSDLSKSATAEVAKHLSPLTVR